MAGGAGEVDPAGLVEVAEVDHHPHGRHPHHAVAARRVPAGGVDRGLAAAELPRAAVERVLHEAGALGAQGLVLQEQAVQPAPVPAVDVLAELGGQLPAGVDHGALEQVVAVVVGALAGAVGRRRPPVALRLVHQQPHDLEPAVAAVRLRLVGVALAALADLVGLVRRTGGVDRVDPQALALDPQLLGQLVAEGELEDVAPHGVEVGGGRRVGVLGVVPALQQLLRLADVLVLDVDLQQLGHEQLGDLAAVVQLHLTHVVGGDLSAVLDLLLDQGGDPLAARAVAPVGGEGVRVVVLVDDGLVGGDDVAALRVVLVGQLVLVDVLAGPAVVGVPAGRRDGAVVALGAHRDPAGQGVADVLAVGVDQVLRGDVEEGGRLAEVVPVLRPVHREDGVHGGARLQRRPAQRHAVAVAAVGGGGLDGGLLADLHQLVVAVGEQGAVVGLADHDLLGLAAGDLDGLLAGLEGDHLAVVLVAGAGDLLQVEVGDVDAGVGQAPGDLLVVSDDHAGHAREGVTRDVVAALVGDGAAVQAHLVPDGRQRGRQVRVVGQQGLAGDGVLAGDDPGVGADAVAVHADGGGQVVQDVLEAGQLGLEGVSGAGAGPVTGAGADARAGAGPGARAGPCSGAGAGAGPRPRAAAGGAAALEGLGQLVVLALLDDRLVPVVGVLRVQVGDLLGAQAAGHQGAVDLVLHVAAQVPGHRLQPGHRVDRRPLLGLVVVGEAEGGVLQGDLRAVLALQVGVDALGVRLEVLLRGVRQLLVVLLLRHPVPAQRAQELVVVHLALAEHLGQPPGGHVAAHVHLVEPVLRLDVPLRHEQVLLGGRVDLRDAVAVALDVDRAGQALQRERAGGLRERRADRADGPVPAVHEAADDGQDQHEDDQAAFAPLLPLLPAGRAGLLTRRGGVGGGHRCPCCPNTSGRGGLCFVLSDRALEQL
ncbi:hypothetical protein ACFVMA_32160 [Streptomyces rochei]|uniref:hypothetical protein n=1 Tax=Streptomyces rochei TaxID=1928 RepID=UPI0036BE554E